MFFTDDPVADAARYAEEQQKELDKLPRCDYCDEPIQDDFYFSINDEVICEECMVEHYRKHTTDLMG